MEIYEIIDKKRKNKTLTQEEISWVIKEYIKGTILDEQMSSLLMAICINGMTERETFNITNAMKNSGETISYEFLVADKHSSGGVSDSTTLFITPLLASLNVKMAKMSGKSLGLTGGTIDKLMVFNGYDANKSIDEFKTIIKNVGASIISQTDSMAIADKKIYALRDRTATVESIPLIASSIMSKKLESNADFILLDVKYGKGAFMKDISSAKKLAKLMVKIGKANGKKVWAVLSNMNIPLADGIGSALEVYSLLMALKGDNPILTDISLTLASIIYQMYNNTTYAKAYSIIQNQVKTDKPIKKLKEIILAHGGDISIIDEPDKLLCTKFKEKVTSNIDGYICDIDANKIAKIVYELKESSSKERKLYQGVMLNVRYGKLVKKGGVLATIYSDNIISNNQKTQCIDAITIKNIKPKKLKLIKEVIK